MQTTLRLDDNLYRRAKTKSSELGLSLTRFMEEALEDRLARLEERQANRIVLPVSSVVGAPLSDEDLRSRIEAAELEDDLARLV